MMRNTCFVWLQAPTKYPPCHAQFVIITLAKVMHWLLIYHQPLTGPAKWGPEGPEGPLIGDKFDTGWQAKLLTMNIECCQDYNGHCQVSRPPLPHTFPDTTHTWCCWLLWPLWTILRLPLSIFELVLILNKILYFLWASISQVFFLNVKKIWTYH